MEEKIILAFRKTITSLTCIEKITHNSTIKSEADKYVFDLVKQYYNYLNTKNIQNIKFKYSEADIIDFSYRCIENDDDDLVWLAEDVQFGIIELIKAINNKGGN